MHRLTNAVAVIGLILLSHCAALPTHAQTSTVENSTEKPTEDDTTVDRKKWAEVYLTIAKQFQLTSEENRKIDLVPRSLLHWSNPVRVGRTKGEFYVWTNGDRPVMVGTVFSYDAPVTQHAVRALAFELHTLTDSTIHVKRRGEQLWDTPAESLEVIALPNLGAPREQPFQRLREMREIARGLEVTTTLESSEQPLRLLPNPIYRYELSKEAEQRGLLDGAVFAMVTGTDPEILVFVEARRNQDGKAVWQLTPARFTNLPIKLSLNGKLLWENSASSKQRSYRPYMDKHRIYRLPTQLGPEAMDSLNDAN